MLLPKKIEPQWKDIGDIAENRVSFNESTRLAVNLYNVYDMYVFVVYIGAPALKLPVVDG